MLKNIGVVLSLSAALAAADLPAQPLAATPGPLAVTSGQLATAPGIVVATPPPDALPDPADLVPWPEEGYPHFAPDSVVNAGAWLLDAPAGRHGAVRGRPDGQLEFADGTPVRFWGTTLAYGASFPESHAEITAFADTIAAYGYNLLRFHHNDVPWKGIGYLKGKPDRNDELDPEGIDRLDFFAAELIKRGIYIYVDLVDSRPLLEDDGLPGWQELAKQNGGGWKGLFPQPAIVAAWKRAATALLAHRNPYTGRTWGAEPAVAMVECINENGVFWDWGFKVTPAVQQWFDQAWNGWLAARYPTRDKLVAAWTDAAGSCGLFADEDPATGNVYRPQLVSLPEWDRPNGSKARGACRVNDYYQFLAEAATGFYRDATAHLRGLGFSGVVIGSHELQGPLNQLAEVQGTGAIAAHLYAMPRLAWGARPGVSGVTVEGVDVKSRNWFANLLRVKVAGVPGINGEWAGGSLMCRADTNIAVAALSAFQRLPASVHFTLQHRWARQPVLRRDSTYDWADYRKSIGMTFSSLHDVPWLAVNRACAALTIRGDLAPAKLKVQIAYSAEDTYEQNLHALGINGGSGTIGGAALFLPMLHQVESAFFDTVYAGDADVVFTSGRSASGDYRAAKHLVLLGDNPYCDRHHQRRDLGAPLRLIAPAARVVTLDQPVVFTVSSPWATPRTLSFARLEGAIEAASLPAGAQPIGLSADGKYTLGWLDDRHLVLPAGRAFDGAIGDARWLYRLYVAACARWQLPLGDNSADGTAYRGDSGQTVVDWATGTLVLDTPATQGFSGLPGWRAGNAAANLAVTLAAPYGNVLLTSADGAPIARARRMLLTTCGRVMNTGEELGSGKDGGQVVAKVGDAPTLVEALRGSITLRGLARNDLLVHALDWEGRRLGTVPVERTADGLTFVLSPRWRTIWFEIAGPEISATAAPAGAAWPAEESPRTIAIQPPKTITAAQFLALLERPAAGTGSAPATTATAEAGDTRVAIGDLRTVKPFQVYANAVAATTSQAGGPAVRIEFGKHTRDWAGGMWFPVTVPAGTPADGCRGLAFTVTGDGTLPREFYVSLKTTDGSWRSRNLNTWFEGQQPREVLLTAADFTREKGSAKDVPKDAPATAGSVPFNAITQIHLGCVGPLMDNRSVGTFGPFALVLRAADAPVGTLPAILPAAQPLAAPRLRIPLLADALITADGDPSEPAWAKAVGFTMDEHAVPPWQFVGSHVASGHYTAEKARFWLLATRSGLALAADIDKGGAPLVATHGEWWHNDCVELFSDVGAAGGKPTKQLFLAYRKPLADSAAASDPTIAIGRMRTAAGYLLEALIPWPALGFAAAPTTAFGLDLQVDVADAEGRKLQLTYATGTNEAWVTAARFLKVELAP